MDARHFDQLARTVVAVRSRRSVIAGLLGGVLSLSRIRTVGAGHKPRHHCTPSDQHPCLEGECRELNGEWTCQETCVAPGDRCDASSVCCKAAGQTFGCELTAPEPFCDNDPGDD